MREKIKIKNEEEKKLVLGLDQVEVIHMFCYTLGESLRKRYFKKNVLLFFYSLKMPNFESNVKSLSIIHISMVLSEKLFYNLCTHF